MKIFIIGSGGREAALAWALSKSPCAEKIFVAPGNAGTALVGHNVPIEANDIDRLREFASQNQIGLTVVGPDAPLACGIVDRFKEARLSIFGPDQAAARIEASKIFCKELLTKYNIPTAAFQIFDNARIAHEYVSKCPLPIVIKADGLCLGKGVIVAKDRNEAHAAIEEIMEKLKFGDAGRRVVIEEFLEGKECSLMAVCDGESVVPLLAARDYKRAYDQDRGLNTGGMGAYAPVPDFTPDFEEWALRNLLEPTVRALAREGAPFRGLLYAGLMLTKDGPKVLEFNARFGDPETQAVLPLLESDLVELLQASANGSLGQIKVKWSSKKAVCVVLVSEGYPKGFAKGKKITGVERAVLNPDIFVFHAGTARQDNNLVTNGGRVLNVVALGRNHREARIAAYSAAAKISFEGMRYRKDIAVGLV